MVSALYVLSRILQHHDTNITTNFPSSYQCLQLISPSLLELIRSSFPIFIGLCNKHIIFSRCRVCHVGLIVSFRDIPSMLLQHASSALQTVSSSATWPSSPVSARKPTRVWLLLIGFCQYPSETFMSTMWPVYFTIAELLKLVDDSSLKTW